MKRMHIWSNYKILDSEGRVEELDLKQNVNALTHLIQIARFVYGKQATLSSLFGGYLQRFNLYCGQAQRVLTETQKEVMKQIAEYIVGEGAFDLNELNQFDPELWKKSITSFGNAIIFANELQKLSRFILKAA